MIKNRIKLAFVFSFFTIAANAQNAQDESFKNGVVFYLDRNEYPAHLKDSVNIVRVIKRDSTESTLYTVEDYYLSGQRAMIGKTLLPLYNLLQQGVFISYYPNGKRKSVKNFERGIRVGDASYYYPNGKLYFSEHYDSTSAKWLINESRDSLGTILATGGNGNHKEFSVDFKTLNGSGPILNGMKHGKWIGFFNDTMNYVCNYEKGVSRSGVTTSRSGRIINFGIDHVIPEFPGGEKGFSQFLARNFRYPASAKENNIQGKVLLSIVINENGQLSDIKAIAGPGGVLADEAIRIMKASPRWLPAIDFGVVVKKSYTFPITFTLQQD